MSPLLLAWKHEYVDIEVLLLHFDADITVRGAVSEYCIYTYIPHLAFDMIQSHLL